MSSTPPALLRKVEFLFVGPPPVGLQRPSEHQRYVLPASVKVVSTLAVRSCTALRDALGGWAVLIGTSNKGDLLANTWAAAVLVADRTGEVSVRGLRGPSFLKFAEGSAMDVAHFGTAERAAASASAPEAARPSSSEARQLDEWALEVARGIKDIVGVKLADGGFGASPATRRSIFGAPPSGPRVTPPPRGAGQSDDVSVRVQAELRRTDEQLAGALARRRALEQVQRDRGVPLRCDERVGLTGAVVVELPFRVARGGRADVPAGGHAIRGAL